MRLELKKIDWRFSKDLCLPLDVSNPMKANRSIRELALERLQDGVSTSEIAESLKVSKRTVQRWKKEGNNYGAKQVRLKSRKLTDEQEESVLKFIEKKPGVYAKNIVAYAAENFKVKICKTTVHNLFRKHNITRKVGTRVNHRYKVELGRQYLAELQESYTPMFGSIDEASVMLNLTATHGYAIKGKRAVIPQPSRRTVSYMLILCVTPVGVVYWSIRSGTFNAEAFCEVLKNLPNGLNLMLDNARIHQLLLEGRYDIHNLLRETSS